jgi:hypothetical protein
VIAVLRGRQLDEARAVAFDQPRRVVLEAKVRARRRTARESRRRRQPRHQCIGESRHAA